MTGQAAARTGVVVIGRNLGSRLELCLWSVLHRASPVVYSDSASQDESAVRAGALGAEVVRLDPQPELTAARGRNAGAERLLRGHPALDFLQFVDGDCELETSWIPAGVAALDADSTLGAVCGHVREKHARGYLAARLLDLDWRGPVGDIQACGGIFLARRIAFEESGGFLESLAGGEEAELCRRLRARGWRVARIDRPMCVHDAAITTLSGWWKRSVRVGRTYAQCLSLTGDSRDPTLPRRVRSIVLWAAVLPAVAVAGVAAAPWHRPAWLLPIGVVLLHVLQVLRLWAQNVERGSGPGGALLQACSTTVAKWAHFIGCMQHWCRR